MSAPAATKAQVVFEYDTAVLGARNLFSSPLDITGLRGDLYDYELVSFFDAEGVGSSLIGTFNNDATPNYRAYLMRGDGASASAFVDDSSSSVFLGGDSFSFPSLGVLQVRGSSGGERSAQILDSVSSSSGDTKISKRGMYWKNTADELTSFQLSKTVSVTSDFHIVLFATPKDSAQEEWELIKTESWTSQDIESSPIIFGSLAGDVDGTYKISYSIDNLTGDIDPAVRVNNDTGSNYRNQRMYNDNGSMVSANTTADNIPLEGVGNQPNSYEGTILVNAVSGQDRLVNASNSKAGGRSQQCEVSGWWGNTGDDVDELRLFATIASETCDGEASLYRKRTLNKSSDSLPWETVKEIEVSGNFSTGEVVTVNGESDFLYRIEVLATSAFDTDLRIRPNSDASANNSSYQYLRANGALAQAGTGLLDHIELLDMQAPEVSSADLILYPKSGASRPCLSDVTSRETRVEKRAAWWTNTADPITSFLIYASNGASVYATIRVSRIPRTQP